MRKTFLILHKLFHNCPTGFTLTTHLKDQLWEPPAIFLYLISTGEKEFKSVNYWCTFMLYKK